MKPYIVNIQIVMLAENVAEIMAKDGDFSEGEIISIAVQQSPQPVAAPAVEAPATKKPAAKKPAAEKPAAKGKTGKRNAVSDDADPEKKEGSKFKEVSADDVQGILRDMLKTKELGGDAAVSLLSEFNAENVSQVDESSFAALVARGNEIIEAAKLGI